MLAGATASQPGMSTVVDNTFGTKSSQTQEGVKNAIVEGGDKLINGNGQQRGEVIGGIISTVVAGKGLGLARGM